MGAESTKKQKPVDQALLDENRALLDKNYSLQAENHALKDKVRSLETRLIEAEELKRAISEGDLDALVITKPEGELIFTLDSADRAYRVLVETMNEGTVTLACDKTILYCNRRFAELLKISPQVVVGKSIHQFIAPEYVTTFNSFLKHNMGGEIRLQNEGGTFVPVYLSVSSLKEEESPNSWCLVFTDLTEHKQEEFRLYRYNHILEGINKIFSNVVLAKTEEELGNMCLSVSLEVTGSKIGFVGEVGADGLLHDIAISDMGWVQCLMYDKVGHRRPPGDFVLHGLYGSVLDSRIGFFTNDPPSHPDSIGLPSGHPLINSFLGVPLVEDKKVVGMLAVANRNGGYTYEQLEDLETIAPAVTQALKRKRNEQEHMQREVLREAINSINQVIHSSFDFDEIMQKAVSEASVAIGSETAAISLRKDNHWVLSYVYGLPENEVGSEMADDEELRAVLAISTKKPIAINDACTDERVNLNHMKKWGVRSVLVVPLIIRDKVIGVLFFNHHKSTFVFNDNHIDFAAQLSSSISLALENSNLYKSLKIELAERIEAEENLAKMEKIRIKEIHHRIKNNLQVISSLLDLQKEKFSHLEICKTPEVIGAFLESQNRVASMALIHEELYRGDNIDTLDFAAYLKKLTKDIFISYKLGNKNIIFNLNLEQVDLGIDTAIPLGIIVNELVSNFFKHAFPSGNESKIEISLCKTENYSSVDDFSKLGNNCIENSGFNYVLKVSDNGKGIPEEIEIQNIDSLGLQLVNILVDQIDGCIELNRNQGTEFTILFNNNIEN